MITLGRGRDGEERIGRDEEHHTNVSRDTFGLHSEGSLLFFTVHSSLLGSCLFIPFSQEETLFDKQTAASAAVIIPSAKERKNTAQTQNKSTSSLSAPFVHHKSKSGNDNFFL